MCTLLHDHIERSLRKGWGMTEKLYRRKARVISYEERYGGNAKFVSIGGSNIWQEKYGEIMASSRV